MCSSGTTSQRSKLCKSPLDFAGGALFLFDANVDCRAIVHCVHNTNLWGAVVRYSYDHQAVCVNTGVLPPLPAPPLQSPVVRMLTSFGGDLGRLLHVQRCLCVCHGTSSWLITLASLGHSLPFVASRCIEGLQSSLWVSWISVRGEPSLYLVCSLQL